MNKLATRALALGAAAALPLLGLSVVEAQANTPTTITINWVVDVNNAQGGAAAPTSFSWTTSGTTYSHGSAQTVAGNASTTTVTADINGLLTGATSYGKVTEGYTVTLGASSTYCVQTSPAAISPAAVTGTAPSNVVTFALTDNTATAYTCHIAVTNPPAMRIIVTDNATIPAAVGSTSWKFTGLLGPHKAASNYAGELVIADNDARDLDSTVGIIKVAYGSNSVAAAQVASKAGYSLSSIAAVGGAAPAFAASGDVLSASTTNTMGFAVAKSVAGTWKFGNVVTYTIKVTAGTASSITLSDKIPTGLWVGAITSSAVNSANVAKTPSFSTALAYNNTTGVVGGVWSPAAGDVLTVTVPVMVSAQTVTTKYTNTAEVSATGYSPASATVVNTITVGKTTSGGSTAAIGSKAGTSVDAGLLGLAASVSLLGFGAAVAGLRRRDSK